MTDLKRKERSIKRRQVYIKKNFQTKFILKFILVLILGGAISIGLTLLNTKGTLTSSFSNSKLVIENTSIAIMPQVIFTTLITTGIVGILVTLVTLLVSHKIAGPIVRFEKDIDRVAKGDLKTRINIRKGDQFQEIAESLNIMIYDLNKDVSAIKEEVFKLTENNDLPEETQKTIANLNQLIETSFKL